MSRSDAAVSISPLQAGLRDYLELSKARIVLMVVITTAAGFVVAGPSSFDFLLLFHTLIGTAFVAGGTNALNQYMERHLDALMARTRRRPLPDGRITERAALAFSVFISVFGVTYLAVLANPLAAFLALTTLVTYLFVYTPLKRKTTLCTLIGSAPGAIPPMVGWAAAVGHLDPGAWVMFGVLFLWQMPHFLAIGWIYRKDYAKAGFTMLAIGDPEGDATARQAVFYSSLLIPVSLAGLFAGIGGAVYAVAATAASLAFVAAAVSFLKSREPKAAKVLFHVSNLYLLVMMALMVVSSLF